ncbi:MAG TPA: MmcQ/YjbR family DNA-binding protein [Vicinamibacterales bacterium]|nr:MmcQ/YjbR family DNA-binding protein [Vicinamibacterales bacterium]
MAALKLAQRFPGIELHTSSGTPAIKVKGKFMARLRSEAEGWLAIRCDFLARDMLLEADPAAFHLTDHYRDYPMILVDLTKIRKGALLDILEQAWRMTASKKLIREYDEGQAG